jgi:hypothetical protein
MGKKETPAKKLSILQGGIVNYVKVINGVSNASK